MGYTPTVWQDSPSTATPLNAANLNKMEAGIADAAAPGAFPMLKARYYTTHMHMQSLNSDADVFGTTGQRVWLHPLYFPEVTDLDRLGQSIAGTAAGTLWLGIYAWSNTMGNVSLLVQGSTDSSVVGDKQITIAATIPRGPAWGAVGLNSTAGTLRIRRASGPEVVSGAWGSGAGWEAESFFGARFEGINLSSGLPATLNTASPAQLTRTDIPLVFVRRA